jgi:putative oxidoreductase
MLKESAPAAIIFVRAMVGAIFLSEGLQKFPFPNVFGVRRFTSVGIPRRSP